MFFPHFALKVQHMYLTKVACLGVFFIALAGAPEVIWKYFALAIDFIIVFAIVFSHYSLIWLGEGTVLHRSYSAIEKVGFKKLFCTSMTYGPMEICFACVSVNLLLMRPVSDIAEHLLTGEEASQ